MTEDNQQQTGESDDITYKSHRERYRRRKALAEDVRNGMPVAEAARKYELGLDSAQRACREHGVAF